MAATKHHHFISLLQNLSLVTYTGRELRKFTFRLFKIRPSRNWTTRKNLAQQKTGLEILGAGPVLGFSPTLKIKIKWEIFWSLRLIPVIKEANHLKLRLDNR